jgi:hypothetical protein
MLASHFETGVADMKFPLVSALSRTMAREFMMAQGRNARMKQFTLGSGAMYSFRM